MDIYCGNCGEPYDLNEPDLDHQAIAAGECPACDGVPVPNRSLRAQASAELGAILGDDLDGLAAELGDAEYLGVFD